MTVLLEAGADKDKTADNGLTPLCFAALRGLCNVASILMEAGADMNKADSFGNTPLFIAASVRPGDTPLHLTNAEKIVSLLLDAGADKDKANNSGCTPLHVVAMFGCAGHTHIVQVLLFSQYWGGVSVFTECSLLLYLVLIAHSFFSFTKPGWANVPRRCCRRATGDGRIIHSPWSLAMG
jgi:hypothetical protein